MTKGEDAGESEGKVTFLEALSNLQNAKIAKIATIVGQQLWMTDISTAKWKSGGWVGKKELAIHCILAELPLYYRGNSASIQKRTSW